MMFAHPASVGEKIGDYPGLDLGSILRFLNGFADFSFISRVTQEDVDSVIERHTISTRP